MKKRPKKVNRKSTWNIIVIILTVYLLTLIILGIFVWYAISNKTANISLLVKGNDYQFSKTCQCSSRWDVKREENVYASVLEFREFYRYDLPPSNIAYTKTYYHSNPDSINIGDMLQNFWNKTVQIHVTGYSDYNLNRPAVVDGYLWITIK